MRRLLSRRRFEVLALALSATLALLHAWLDDTPVQEVAGRLGKLAGVVHYLEGRATDLQFRLRGPREPHPDVLVVAVDERSAQRYGLWPWPRDRVGQGIRNLHRAGARAIGLDMVFADEVGSDVAGAYREALSALDEALLREPPEVGTRLAMLRSRLDERASLSPDQQLAQALREVPIVVQGAIAYPQADASHFAAQLDAHQALAEKLVLTQVTGPLPAQTLDVPLEQVGSWRAYGLQPPLPLFVEARPLAGHFNTVPDPDGTLRRTPPFVRLERPLGLLPSLELQTAAVYFGASKVEPVYDAALGRLSAARILRKDQGALLVPIQAHEPFSLVDHVGPRASFKTLSFSDIVDGNFDPAKVAGKAVLVGVTLVGDFDQRVTPFSAFEPGVFSHASFLSNILSGRFLTRPLGMRALELGFMLLSALLLARVMPRVRYTWKLGTILGLAAGWLVVDQWLFVRGIQLATVMPVANVALTAFGLVFLGYLSVDREKAQLRHAFQHYLGDGVMQEVLANPEKLKLGGEKKELTVLFSDIRGFTTLAERMTPEALVKFINSYLTPMTRIVFEEQGTLDKYIGDALMAFWGAPTEQPDHAVRACRAAVRSVQKLDELRAQWRDQNLPEFDIGIGINTGPMVVGNMGSDIRFDYTVMGDSVNLASRLEGTNKQYETRILMSEATWAQVHHAFVTRRLGAVRVKGKRKPVGIYELRREGVAEGTEQAALTAFEAGLASFTEQRFDEAKARFEEVLSLWPEDAPSRRYLEELAELELRPPGPGWDGVYTATTK